MQPTPERYKEIQQALVAKGYLKGEPTGTWNQESADAMRRFQQDQNINASGKIDSLSLIALGLGPKRASNTQPPAPAQAPAPPSEPKPDAQAPPSAN
jgi:peptidoglycan hydrolase-like protein with peptidoglycan-binding domain